MSLFDTLMVSLKDFFFKLTFKDNMQNILFSRYIDNFIPLMS